VDADRQVTRHCHTSVIVAVMELAMTSLLATEEPAVILQ